MNEWMNPTNLHFYPWNKHIRKETTFLPENKNFLYIFYYEAQMKSKGFSSRKQNDT